jgi:uncharacterized protein (DUF1684 family)
VVFPKAEGPAEIGVFILENGQVTIKVNKGVEIFRGKELVSALEMQSDATGDPTLLHYGTLSWFVIARGDKIGIRLRDSSNPGIAGFKGIGRFPVSEKWRIEARFEPYDSVKTIAVPTVLGTISESLCSGTLVFKIGRKTYSIDPITEEDSQGYFIIFGDTTNGTETYGAGRGKVILDFNKAYNPPCAFSPFATCPLPPEQNILPIAVKAGEKAYTGGH